MSIRHLAICVFRHQTRILVGRGFDEETKEPFLRPLGGAVEFGERVVDALRREIREELGVEITNPVQLGVLENLFTYCGQPGHEIVFVFDAEFADPQLYSEPTLPLLEPVWGGSAEWLDLVDPSSVPLYPEGLAKLLEMAG